MVTDKGQAKIRRAKNELLPEINKLIEAEPIKYGEAYLLAAKAEKYIAKGPTLEAFFKRISTQISITTEPPGAKILFRGYHPPEEDWDDDVKNNKDVPAAISVKLDKSGDMPPGQKDLKLYDTGHIIPGNEFIKETLNWLDKYLGPVK